MNVDVLTFGRSGVDIYPLQIGVGLEDVETFGKFLGGTTANVAVAAARLGRRGGDHHRASATTRSAGSSAASCVRLGVDDAHVVTITEYPTPVTFCEIFPPDDFPLCFYRRPTAPDLQIRAGRPGLRRVRDAGAVWVSVTGLSEEPSRAAHHAVLEARGAARHTVLDLDYRPMFWDTPRARPRPGPEGPRRRSPSRSATARSARSRSARPTPSARPTRCSTPACSWPS